ncbi:MAG: hypothetical protein M0R38_04430 [Bacteroidia bacterium]|nr:hypothetical protein [Bacteroidia bacterium]
MTKKVLIICFTFPPYPGIGGRRWAKFAKYLAESGVDVSVIAAKKKQGSVSSWASDIESYREKIEYIKTNYPLVLTRVPKTFIEKVCYKLALLYVKLFTKGNYYDHSVFWRKNLLKATEGKIKQGYNNIIVSCAPFATAYYVAELKEKYPNINLIVDFRDPWTNNKTSFGFTTISSKRLEVEKVRERVVANKSDYILTVSDAMTDYYKSFGTEKKCLTVKNGFDYSDFESLEGCKSQNEKLRFVFAGTFYHKSLHVFENFCESLREIREENEDVFNKLEFHFFGDMPMQFKEIAGEIVSIVFHNRVSLESAYMEIAKGNLAMLFLTDDLNHSFSTKFYEYIALQKLIAVFSSRGETACYVEENRLGYACDLGNIKNSLLKIHSDWKKGALVFNQEYNLSQHDVKNICQDQIIPLLK